MTINTDRITKLTTKLGLVEEKIGNLNLERTEIIDQIQAELGGTGVTTKAAKTTPTKMTTATKQKSGTPIGDQILTYLETNPAQSLADIATAIKVPTKQVGLSLYHLGKKGAVTSDHGMYYIPTPVAKAAKTVPNPEEDEDEVSF